MVRLSLIGGRQTIRFDVPDYAATYVGNPVDTADLIERDRQWWLHSVVTVPAPEIEPYEQRAYQRRCPLSRQDAQ